MPDLTAVKPGDTLPERAHRPDEVQLFMYNAAIWNPHRIHYDHPYTTGVERHPGIVIDGPLQGDWLTQVVLEWIGDDADLIEFRYSNRKASYLGETLRVRGNVKAVDVAKGEVSLELGVWNEQEELITPGSAKVLFRR